MAKVSGPLMSMDARGKFGSTLVFSGWKGRPTVRQWIIPTNPMSADQETARNRVRVCGAAQHFANLCLLLGGGRAVTDKEAITAITPSGQAWNGTLVKGMVGAGGVTYAAARAAYALLTAGEKTAWSNAAAALVPAIPAVAQFDAGGVPGTPMADGEVFYVYTYGLYSLGITTAPTGVPPVYA